MLTTGKVKKQERAEGGMKRPGQGWSQGKENWDADTLCLPAAPGSEGNLDEEHNQSALSLNLSHRTQHPQHVRSK